MIALGIAIAAIATLLAMAGLGMTGHMAGHMVAVAVAAPVLAAGMIGRACDPAALWPRLVSPLGLATAELVLVWTWHLPALRDAADGSIAFSLIEQASFLGIGVLLWRAALARPSAGIGALLLTSMHMTLLGALIGLAPRPLYPMMAMHPAPGLDALADQQLGGVVMLVIGGMSYLLGGLWLLGGLLRSKPA